MICTMVINIEDDLLSEPLWLRLKCLVEDQLVHTATQSLIFCPCQHESRHGLTHTEINLEFSHCQEQKVCKNLAEEFKRRYGGRWGTVKRKDPRLDQLAWGSWGKNNMLWPPPPTLYEMCTVFLFRNKGWFAVKFALW